MKVKLWSVEYADYFGTVYKKYFTDKEVAQKWYDGHDGWTCKPSFCGSYKPENAAHKIYYSEDQLVTDLARYGWDSGDEEKYMQKNEGCTKEEAEKILSDVHNFVSAMDFIKSCCDTEEEKNAMENY